MKDFKLISRIFSSNFFDKKTFPHTFFDIRNPFYDPDDSAWPHKEIRDIFEVLLNHSIEEGILSAQISKRGVVIRAKNEGGVQELQLTKKWEEWAVTTGNTWPRTTTLLKKIAQYWRQSAKEEDIRAEQSRIRLR
ncbi:MAG: hypothetical protein H7844_00465 [Nitrospirae bacterium YQR-1]